MNVGVFVAFALLLDVLLWLFILLGWESVAIPPDFRTNHQPEFLFPYSQSLLAAGVWSALAGASAARLWLRVEKSARRVAVLAAMTVFSHWALDVVVHRPEMPVTGSNSTSVGLALWNNMPVALVLEAVLAVVGLWLFLAGSDLERAKTVGLTLLSLVILAFTLVGMTIAPAPPSASTMAASSLVALAVVCALFGWLGRPSHGRRV